MGKRYKRIIIVTLIILALLILYYVLQLNWISVKTTIVHLDDLPQELEGYTIVYLSDLPHKEFENENKKLMNKINQIHPDMLIMTGDGIMNTQDIPNNGDGLIKWAENLHADYPIYYVTDGEEGELFSDDDARLFNEEHSNIAVIREFEDFPISHSIHHRPEIVKIILEQ